MISLQEYTLPADSPELDVSGASRIFACGVLITIYHHRGCRFSMLCGAFLLEDYILLALMLRFVKLFNQRKGNVLWSWTSGVDREYGT